MESHFEALIKQLRYRQQIVSQVFNQSNIFESEIRINSYHTFTFHSTPLIVFEGTNHTECRITMCQCGSSWDTSITSTTNASLAESSAVAKAGTALLVQALKSTASQDVSSFHFAGHNRGKASPPSLSELIGPRIFLHDLPQLPELDDLFSLEGKILDAHKWTAELFGSFETWFLVIGSTCGIQASVMATCSPGISVLDLSSFLSDFLAVDPLRITLSASDLHLSGYETDDISAGGKVFKSLYIL
ncbi:hypothetical protein GUJ93_ZPchr0003g18021 [Zizania palustris]|uniref:Orn/Lys/Arg decarboxylases family 1 pyridoxal-P attachment site domain-containing protein n=1 Tax=Zizania palustris TaxID=103762 RepID=A0A8J5VX79_ZIZPA|nr:hypothetical protein GUJ93_ZPchr0003g18021 [Zizania palustris]